eukprot:Em0019g203a
MAYQQPPPPGFKDAPPGYEASPAGYQAPPAYYQPAPQYYSPPPMVSQQQSNTVLLVNNQPSVHHDWKILTLGSCAQEKLSLSGTTYLMTKRRQFQN